jgi:hypothetical protein
VCYDRGSLELTHTSDTDRSDPFSFCVRADQVELGAKIIYYSAKLFKILKGSVPPIPPEVP